jgi:hypothetical protein
MGLLLAIGFLLAISTADNNLPEGTITMLSADPRTITISQLEQTLSSVEITLDLNARRSRATASETSERLLARVKVLETRMAALSSSKRFPVATARSVADTGSNVPMLIKDASWLSAEANSKASFGVPDTTNLPGPPIPFYMYAGPDFEFGETCHTKKMHPNSAFHAPVDVAAELALRVHPWRTLNASEAVLFFAPLYTSCSIICGDRSPAVQAVRASAAYQKHQGANHFTISSDWCQHKKTAEGSRALMGTFGTTFGFVSRAQYESVDWIIVRCNYAN